MKNYDFQRKHTKKLDTIRENMFHKTQCLWVTESQK